MASYAAPLHRYASPLRRWLRQRGYQVAAVTPPEAVELLREAAVSAAMVPLASYREAGGRLCRMAPMVWSRGETMSVVVVSRDGRGLGECGRIAVTGESRTSILYLAAVLAEMGVEATLAPMRARGALALLREAPCALVLGDNALEARARGLSVVADVGALVYKLFRVHPVYAVSVAAPGERCPRGPPWPRALERDAVETSRATGLPLWMARRYHQVVRLEYNEQALLESLWLLRRGAGLLPGLLEEPGEEASHGVIGGGSTGAWGPGW